MLLMELTRVDFATWDPHGLSTEQIRDQVLGPLAAQLGYGGTGANRFKVDWSISNPEASIGGLKWLAEAGPSLMLIAQQQPACLLKVIEVGQAIFDPRLLSQVYRTAIHGASRVPYFGVCNGEDFVLFGTHMIEPVLELPVRSLAYGWDDLRRCLEPQRVFATASSVARDLGVHLLRLGFSGRERFQFSRISVRGLSRLSGRRFSFTAVTTQGMAEDYLATFELGLRELEQLEDQLAPQRFSRLRKPTSGRLRIAEFARTNCQVDLECHLCEEPEENGDEVFLPLRVDRIIKVPTDTSD